MLEHVDHDETVVMEQLEGDRCVSNTRYGMSPSCISPPNTFRPIGSRPLSVCNSQRSQAPSRASTAVSAHWLTDFMEKLQAENVEREKREADERRRLLDQTRQELAERDKQTAERDRLARERENLARQETAERDRLAAERDRLARQEAAERENLVRQEAAERDRLAAEREHLAAERDRLARQEAANREDKLIQISHDQTRQAADLVDKQCQATLEQTRIAAAREKELIQLAQTQQEIAAQKLQDERRLALEREDRLRDDFRALAAAETKAALLEQQLQARAKSPSSGRSSRSSVATPPPTIENLIQVDVPTADNSLSVIQATQGQITSSSSSATIYSGEAKPPVTALLPPVTFHSNPELSHAEALPQHVLPTTSTYASSSLPFDILQALPVLPPTLPVLPPTLPVLPPTLPVLPAPTVSAFTAPAHAVPAPPLTNHLSSAVLPLTYTLTQTDNADNIKPPTLMAQAQTTPLPSQTYSVPSLVQTVPIARTDTPATLNTTPIMTTVSQLPRPACVVPVSAPTVPGIASLDAQNTVPPQPIHTTIAAPSQPNVVFVAQQQQVRPFNGQTKWKSFKEHFNRVAKVNSWTDSTTQAQHLMLALEGPAAEILKELDESSPTLLQDIWLAISRRFGELDEARDALRKFEQRRQLEGETVQEFEMALRALYRLAWPQATQEHRDLQLKTKFEEGILSGDMQQYLRLHATTDTFDQTVQKARRFAATADQPKPRKQVRIVTPPPHDSIQSLQHQPDINIRLDKIENMINALQVSHQTPQSQTNASSAQPTSTSGRTSRPPNRNTPSNRGNTPNNRNPSQSPARQTYVRPFNDTQQRGRTPTPPPSQGWRQPPSSQGNSRSSTPQRSTSGGTQNNNYRPQNSDNRPSTSNNGQYGQRPYSPRPNTPNSRPGTPQSRPGTPNNVPRYVGRSNVGCYVCGHPGCHSQLHPPYERQRSQRPQTGNCFTCGQPGCRPSNHRPEDRPMTPPPMMRPLPSGNGSGTRGPGDRAPPVTARPGTPQ